MLQSIGPRITVRKNGAHTPHFGRPEIGLYDWWKDVDSETAGKLFNDGALSLSKILPYYDIGALSAYDICYVTRQLPEPYLSIKPLIIPGYQGFHVELLAIMYDITKNKIFDDYAKKFYEQSAPLPKPVAAPPANITAAAPEIHSSPSKSTPADTDKTPLADSAASVALKKLNLDNLKAAIPSKAEIVASGSNPNGGFVQFSDGTQICWFATYRTDIELTSYGALYQGDTTVTFAKEFSAPPEVTVSTFSAATQRGWGSVVATTTSGAILSGMDVKPRKSGTTFLVSYTALGRWF